MYAKCKSNANTNGDAFAPSTETHQRTSRLWSKVATIQRIRGLIFCFQICVTLWVREYDRKSFKMYTERDRKVYWFKINYYKLSFFIMWFDISAKRFFWRRHHNISEFVYGYEMLYTPIMENWVSSGSIVIFLWTA